MLFGLVACRETHEHTLSDWQKGESGHWKVCTDPKCDTSGEKIAFAAHTYGEWIVKDEPTYTLPGSKEGQCECSDKETEPIPALGHDMVNGKCSRCERQESVGLEFKLNTDGESYSVAGIGICEDTDIVVPSTYESKPVTSIGNEAFENCRSLTSITIPDSVKTIGDSAFLDCRSLTSIVIPHSVTSIGDKAFWDCSSLTSVTIGNGVSIGDSAFVYCSSLTEIRVASGNSVYYSQNNCLIETATKTLILGCQTSLIPSDVTSIGDYAFGRCYSLTSIVIPDSVTSIGDYAFGRCYSLTSIVIPDSVTSIGNGAFAYCSSLTSITIPDSVTSIGDYAFGRCHSLTSIVIPDSVTSIGNKAFYDCSSLTKIIYQGTKEQWKNIKKGADWNYSTGNYTIRCTDGALTKNEASA